MDERAIKIFILGPGARSSICLSSAMCCSEIDGKLGSWSFVWLRNEKEKMGVKNKGFWS